MNGCFVSAGAAALLATLSGCGSGIAVDDTVSAVTSAAASAGAVHAAAAAGIRATKGPQSTAGQMCAVSIDRGPRIPALCAHCAP